MNLKTYVKNLNKFLSDNPNFEGMDVITSNDDEGNGFTPVTYAPSGGYYHLVDATFAENGSEGCLEINAVCVN